MQCETFHKDENYDDAAESFVENNINVDMNESKTQNHFLGGRHRSNEKEILSLTSFSQLPYLHTKDYYILLHTGSSINLISRKYVYQRKEKFEIFEENQEKSSLY